MFVVDRVIREKKSEHSTKIYLRATIFCCLPLPRGYVIIVVRLFVCLQHHAKTTHAHNASASGPRWGNFASKTIRGESIVSATAVGVVHKPSREKRLNSVREIAHFGANIICVRKFPECQKSGRQRSLVSVESASGYKSAAYSSTSGFVEYSIQGPQDGQNLISWRWSLPSSQDPVW